MVQEFLQRRQEPWRWVWWPATGSWQWPTEIIIEADPLTITWEVAKELNVHHSTVIYNLKQIGKVKRSIRGCLMLLLSCFSRVWFCATPQTAAHQASLSPGFSRQEHWSGLPLASPGCSLADRKSRKLSFWSVTFSYSTQQQRKNFLIGLWCVTKSGFYVTTSDDPLSGWTKKKLQSTSQTQTCTKKRSWSLFGGLLPI